MRLFVVVRVFRLCLLMFMLVFMTRVLLCFMWCLHLIMLFVILSACDVVPLLDGLIVCLFSAFACVRVPN